MTTTSSSQTPNVRNWSVLAIPCAYGLAFPTHIYGLVTGLAATGGKLSNVSPRANPDLLRGKIPAATLDTLIRARGAHLNTLEVFPLFASAMLVGNWAKLPAKDLNNAAEHFLIARILHSVCYVTTTSEALSYLRSGAYAWSLAAPAWILWQAGKKIRD